MKFLLFAACTLAAMALLASTIANFSLNAERSYRAVFADVTGLLPHDDVRVAGVRVGKVERVRLTEGGQAEVAFTVDERRPLTTGARALIRYRNLVGGRYIELTEGADNEARPLASGDSIPLAQTKSALNLTALFNGFKPLFAALSPDDMNKLAYEITRVLQGEGGTINSLLSHTASLTGTIADRDKAIGDVITNLNRVLGSVDARDEQFSQLITELQRVVSGLADDRKAIGSALGDIDDITAATADMLEDGRPAIRTDIRELAAVTKTLGDDRALIDDILRRLPGELNEITRTASYGSWYQFYLCDLDGYVVLPDGRTYTPNLHVDQGRCAR